MELDSYFIVVNKIEIVAKIDTLIDQFILEIVNIQLDLDEESYTTKFRLKLT